MTNYIDEGNLPVKKPSGAANIRYEENGKSYKSAMPDVVAAAAIVQQEIDGIIADGEERLNQLVADAQSDIDAVVNGIGYLPPVAFASGLNVDSSRFTVTYDGVTYAPVADAIPFTTTGTFDPGQWRLVQGVSGADLAAPTGAAMVGFRQPGERAELRTVQDRLRDEIHLKDYGAKGDSETDDTGAFMKFITECMERGVTGVITSGNYYVPGITLILITAPLSIVGRGPTRPVLNGGKLVANYAFCLTKYEAHFENVEFRNFIDVFSAGNGSGGTMPNTVNGDVASFSLSRVGFRNCRRATFFFIDKDGPRLGDLRIVDCDFDGETSARAGFFCDWTNIDAAVVTGNVVRNIDASDAGYNSTNGAPQNIGNGRAILVGGNNPSSDYVMARWSVCDNLVENVTDSRAKVSGVNPEVGGIRVTGVRFAEICRNRIANVSSTGEGVDDDCEGIYPKAAYTVICNNVLDNAGENGGAIIVKGYNRARIGYDSENPSADGWSGVLTGNIIRRTDGKRGSGIAIYSSDWIVENNHVEGCGGNSSRYAPIWVNADQNDNVVIRGNNIKDAIGIYGILSTCYGKHIRIENNIIDGVLCSYDGLGSSHSYGVYILNGNSGGNNTEGVPLADAVIGGNHINGVVAMPGQQARGIAVYSAGSNTERLRIMDNVIASAVDVGVQIQNGTYSGVTIRGNDLRLATTKYNTAGSPIVSDLAASGNLGWLSASTQINPPSVAPGETITVGTVSVANTIQRDPVKVTSSLSLQGMLLWGQVTATDVVTIYLFNPTGSAVDLGTVTFRVEAEKFVA